MLNEFNEVVELSDDTNIQDLFGNNNKNIELLEELLQVKIITRGESLSITGEEEPVQH
ncbi:PhoH family protein, partial [Listeria monocytogenes]